MMERSTKRLMLSVLWCNLSLFRMLKIWLGQGSNCSRTLTSHWTYYNENKFFCFARMDSIDNFDSLPKIKSSSSSVTHAIDWQSLSSSRLIVVFGRNQWRKQRVTTTSILSMKNKSVLVQTRRPNFSAQDNDLDATGHGVAFSWSSFFAGCLCSAAERDHQSTDKLQFVVRMTFYRRSTDAT